MMDEIVRAHDKPTATLIMDHEYIQNWVAQIEATVGELADATPGAQNWRNWG
jgi:hypothetical protein